MQDSILSQSSPVREAKARQIYRVWHKLARQLARQQAARRGADLTPPYSGYQND